MTAPLFAAEIPDYLLIPIKVFALIGAAAAGGFGASWVAAAVAKMSFNQSVPSGLRWLIRTLGFTASGLLAYFWLFGAGGGGLGGGGWGFGGRDGGPKDGQVVKKDDSPRKDRDKEKDKSEKDGSKPPPEETVRVEVLGDTALKRVAGGGFDPERRYRIQGRSELLTLPAVKEAVGKQLDKPTLLEVVLYEDSPDRKVDWVQKLEAWGDGLAKEKGNLQVKVSEQKGNAPGG